MQKHFTKAIEVDLGLPNEHVDLAGFSPSRKWNGSGGGLKASLLVSDLSNGTRLVFGSIDTLFIDAQFHNELTKKLGKRYHLNIVAAHTHNAPALAKAVSKLGKVSDSWFNSVILRIADAIHNGATVALREIGCGSIETDLVINRRLDAWLLDYQRLKRGQLCFAKSVALAPNSSGNVDNKIRAVFFRCSAGKVRTIIWSLSAHAAFAENFFSISADFPGVVRQFLKEIYGDELVSIFLPGFAGSSIPRCSGKPLFKRSFMQILVAVLPFNSSIPPLDSNSYQRWSKKAAKYIEDIGVFTVWKDLNQLPHRLEKGESIIVFKDRFLGDITVCFTMISFGGHVKIITVNGELLSEWSGLLNSLLSSEGSDIISGYGAGSCLYVPPESEIARGGYEVERFQQFFGLSGKFVKNIDKKIKNGVEKVLRQMG